MKAVLLLMELGGIAMLGVAGWWLAPWVGLGVAGIGLIAAANAADWSLTRDDPEQSDYS